MAGRWLRGLGLSIAMLLMWTAAPASAAWFEARSRHFIVYSEGTPASVRKFASDLERFDQGVRKLLGYPDTEGDDPNPVTVYTLDGIGAVNSLCRSGRADTAKDCRYVAGFYNSRVSGSVAFVPRRAGGGGPFEIRAETILFHEYVHHLMLANSGAAYPAWYVEGFAEFVSNAKVDDEGAAGIGLPAASRATALAFLGGLPMHELLTVNPSKLSPNQRALFYARAWLLTHYLTFSKERDGQLTKYLIDINKGVPATQAAIEAFGDLKKFDYELSGYQRRSRLQYLAVPVAPIPADSIRIRQLDAGEAAMMRIRIRSDRGVDRATAPDVAEDARSIAAPYPDNPGVQTALAEAEFDAGNGDAAEAAADRAIASDPKNMTAMIYKALVLMRRARESGERDAAVWRGIRQWLLKANQVQPDAAWPLSLYYLTFRMEGEKPTANAAAALQRAFELVPQDDGVRLNLVQHYLSEEKLDEARAALAPLALNPHISPEHPAVKLMARIDEHKNGDKGLLDTDDLPLQLE